MVPSNKVTIVGANIIGMSCAAAILLKNLTCHLALVDQNESKVIGEALDFLHASIYLNNAKILAGKDYAITSHSALCIVTSSIEQQPDELEIDYLNRYVELYKSILPNLVHHSPDTVIVVVGKPIGILTFAAWKISRLPKNRIFGVAINLDSLKFRHCAASKLEIGTTNLTGWSIGQNELLSSLNVAGVKLTELETSDLESITKPERPNESNKIFENWAIALNCTEIAVAILKNSNKIFSVATSALGLFGISGNVFLSLPCIIGRNGITNIVNLSISETEKLALQPVVDNLEKLNLKITL